MMPLAWARRFGRQWMRTEISVQTLHRELRELFLRALRVNGVLIKELRQALGEIDRAERRIARLHREIHSFAVGFELLVLDVDVDVFTHPFVFPQ